MGKKSFKSESAKLQSAIDNDKDSRNSTNGYLETGNPAEVPAKLRALRNHDNGAH